MAEIKEFKTQTKKLLDMMINSIYSNKEIFLRELISNASDAIDKYHFSSLTNKELSSRDYQITITSNKEERTLTLQDNGIGFTYDELVENLGTIAKSGSKEFLENLEDNKAEVDIIGQFGVGFYSAFMISKEIEVITKSPFSDKTYIFKSDGLEKYSIDTSDENIEGTKIVLHLRENQDEINFDDYLDEYTIKELVRKYSDYIRYPIKTLVTKYKDESKEDSEENSYQELETINSMVPIWKKSKSEVTEEGLNGFYKQKFMDFQDPLISMHIKVEGNVTYDSLIFIPRKPMFNMPNTKDEKGLQLYTKGVFILDKCKELIPDYLKFAKGLVDSSDLSLNISREMLQEDKMVSKIAENLEKRIISELNRIKKSDYERYVEFFNTYGVNIKYGIYDQFGQHKDKLKDLIIFNTVESEKMLSLKEYVENMPEDQKFIYYANGTDKEAILRLPQMDKLKERKFDLLILKDDVDEFMIQVLKEYDSKQFKNINQGDLDLLTDEDKQKVEEIAKEKEDILKAIKTSLNDKVKDVVISKRLVSSAVCLSSEEGISFQMEKVLKQSGNDNVSASKILEINPEHEVFKAIENVYNNKQSLDKYANLLYSQALLIEGIPLENPIEFSNLLCELMLEKSN